MIEQLVQQTKLIERFEDISILKKYTTEKVLRLFPLKGQNLNTYHLNTFKTP